MNGGFHPIAFRKKADGILLKIEIQLIEFRNRVFAIAEKIIKKDDESACRILSLSKCIKKPYKMK